MNRESTTEQLALGWVWKGDWNSVITDRVFLEIRAGQFGANRREKPNGSSPRFEDVATLRVRGGHRDFQGEPAAGAGVRIRQLFQGWPVWKPSLQERRRDLPDPAGRHLEEGISRRCAARRPERGSAEVLLFETPSISEAGVWSYAAYASDSWRLNSRVTLNLGLRIDRYRVFLPEQEHPVGRFNPTARTFAAVENVIDWNVPAPRMAFITDLAGDGRTVLKFSYGVYWVNPGVETGFNANPNSSQWWQRYTWSDLDGSGVWEPGEQGRPPGSAGGRHDRIAGSWT